MRRVVITGVGTVSPWGTGCLAPWSRARESGQAAIGLLSDDPAFDGLPASVAARVPRPSRRGALTSVGGRAGDACLSGLADSAPALADGLYDSAEWVARRDGRSVDGVPFIEWSLAAAELALRHADLIAQGRDAGRGRTLSSAAIDSGAAEVGSGLMLRQDDGGHDPDRFGVAFGTGIGCLDEIGRAHALSVAGKHRRVSPFFVPRILPNMGAGNVAIRFGLRGPALSPATACASGSHAIGDAFRLIRSGDADAMVAGAAEAAVDPLTVAGFARARALTRSADPAAASRPFDRSRDGFVIGEGAVAVCMEERGAALRRGAPILAEVVGYGLSCDASHITAPPADGAGALRAMRASLRDAAADPASVALVVAHATSTPIGDAAEAAAIGALLGGDHAKGRRAPAQVVSMKGSVGHLLGAAGAVNVAAAVEAMQGGGAPVNAGLSDPEDWFDGKAARLSDGSPIEPTAEGEAVVICNAFGFGGTNASLCFRPHRTEQADEGVSR